ncbi:MAG: SDR family oxidoreductase [Gammaproteobacteria bacterium]|nr:SDR family oxidoreductase [Gammaproteobacteria bacterium]
MRRRTALVTGSGQNIGRAIALGLAADGFDIVVNGLSKREQCEETAEVARAQGVDALVVMADAGTSEGCTALAGAAIERFGAVHVLVHNAAIRPQCPFLEMDEGALNRVFDVNFMAAFRLSQLCLPGMIEAKWGRIVTFAGMNAISGYNGRAHVSVSKHAAWGFAKALAKEFAPSGITVNCISPGPISTGRDDPGMTAHITAMEARVPLGRLGEPGEVAAAVSLLASEKGAFINGQLIQVNGGAQT